MKFSITVGSWIIPAILTVILWIFLNIKNPSRPIRDYDFGLDYLLAFLIGIIGTLVIWLVYTILLLIFK